MVGKRGHTGGFTLLEILVVLFIIGIVVSFAVLTVGDRVAADRLQREAERLQALLDIAAEEAVLFGVEIGLDISGPGYRFLRLAPDGWEALGGDGPLRPRELPEGAELRLTREDDDQSRYDRLTAGADEEDEDSGPRPEVLFLSSGEVTPFELVLRGYGLRYVYTGALTGEIAMQRKGQT